MSDLDLLPIGTLRLDENLNVISASSKFLEVFRCEQQSLIGKKFEDLYWARERKNLIRLDQALSNYSGGLLDLQLAVMVFGETKYYCRLKLQKVVNEWVVFLTDTYREDNFLHQLIVSEEIWTSVINESSDAIAILGPDRHLKRFNNTFFKIMKLKSIHDVILSEEAVLGKELTQFKCNKNFEKLFQYISDKNMSYQSNFKQVVYLDNTFLDIQAYPLHVPVRGFSGTCIVIKDLTAQQQNEQLRLKNAHFMGMAEVATGIIHNIGNIFNSVNVSLETTQNNLRNSKIQGLQKAAAMLQANHKNLANFLLTNPKGNQLIDYIIQVTEALKTEFNFLESEIVSIRSKLDTIREVIRNQQDYAKGAGLVEQVDLRKITEESIQIQMANLKLDMIEVRTQFQDVSPVLLQRNKLMHILINLLTNSKEALKDVEKNEKIITVEVGKTNDNFPFVKVSDNGSGIASENLQKIFIHGFTTKPNGHGFGLHFCANAMTEMGGQLIAESQGIGRGASFTLIWKNK